MTLLSNFFNRFCAFGLYISTVSLNINVIKCRCCFLSSLPGAERPEPVGSAAEGGGGGAGPGEGVPPAAAAAVSPGAPGGDVLLPPPDVLY